MNVVFAEEGDPIVDTSRGSILRELADGRMIWGSERDGYNHLYLLNGSTGEVLRQVTSGPWVVDGIERVDEEAGLIFFTARGREPGRDPYLLHAYSIRLDGGEPTLLTPEPANHSVSFSPDGQYLIDSYSTPQEPPVTVLRRASDGSVVMELERADISRLTATGWTPPEPFRVKARDGETDIYGILWFPAKFDPSRSYPIVEQIYTGPHGFFTPKTFDAYRSLSQALADRLRGKLLLAHGDIDENVPVSATIRMADALIQADRDFDLLIMPNQPHGFWNHPYFVRRRWDYFVQHLLGVEPPEYSIGAD